MIEWFSQPHPVSQALLAGVFTWGITAFGASIVFCIRTLKRSLLNGMLGLAANVPRRKRSGGLLNYYYRDAA